MKKYAFLILLLACLAARPANAIYMTGKELTEDCAGESAKELYSCTAYIAGIIDYEVMLQSLGAAPVIDFCLPENAPIEQVSMNVLAWLQKNPQNGEFIAVTGVALALNKIYPCKKKK
jgi:hypothetical protein